MGELSAFLAILKGAPTEATLILSAVFIVTMLVLNMRKVNMDAVTSISKVQTDNLKALTEQNQALAKDLHEMRQHQAELYEKLDQMREELTSARTELQNTREELQDTRKHVLKLEGLLRQYHARCSDCPNGPGPEINQILLGGK